MRYEVLGPLRLSEGDVTSSVSAGKMQELLATLLVRSGQVVSPGQLIGEMWGEDPPPRATACLHVYVCRLRKMLRQRGPDRPRILTTNNGYTLRMGADELDAALFQQLVSHGRAAAHQDRHDHARRAFTQALCLWRGSALDGLHGGPIVQSFVACLEEARLECTELLVETNLALGRHRESLGLMYALTQSHPRREAFWRHFMVALYRSGLRADALHVYASVRRFMRKELGLEPCHALRDLHREILLSETRPEVPTGELPVGA